MSGEPRGEVLMMPTFANPYQRVLAEDLEALGWRVTLGQPGRREFRRLVAGRLPEVVHLHWLEAFFRAPTGARGVWRRLGQPLRAALGLLALAIARGRGARLVFTFHELHDHAGRFRAVKVAFARLVARLAQVVIVHSEHARAGAAAALGLAPARLRVAPLPDICRPLPAAPSRAEARRQLGLPPEARVLAFLGMVGPYKGVDDLVEAFRARPEPDLYLLVMGAPNPEDYGPALAARVAAVPRLELRLAWARDEDLVAAAAAADLLVFPFRAITTTSSVLLATGRARPALAARLGNVPELLSPEVAILYPPGELARGLAEALERWTELPAMGARAGACHARVCGRASAAAHAVAYAESEAA